ncbi:fumarate reductase flavoprotein subunit [Rhizobium petrolearium]|uniref:FAD-dependent oxidoreductase n=2 Tax=Neorhizobium TaxID=1525371 RepID=A0ABV0MCT9_9HYPH|nr:FAD-dependent oxidoreductase [Neorhizobium petrolearium]MBP1848420.1 fumarate reductase flavoprotein subunit [Neorhizobium petrolearium]MCC2614479.1 FAD-dependent oxidoreductase [Neorhizobium petrolearium]WGI72241.1 FAD-dependent oxidoreductase [Neorhizobium petrolearium]
MKETARSQDVLIVGGGLAGMSSAIRAAELGLSVRVIEQGTGEHYLCNSRYTGGLFHIGMEDMRSEPAELIARLKRVTGGETRVSLATMLARNAARAIAWLRTQGVGLIRVGPDGLRQNSLAPPGVRNTGLNWHWRAGDVMLRTLNKRLAELGGRFDQGVIARKIVAKNGRVSGLLVSRNGREERLDAPVVILCDGGFQAKRELIGRYISPAPDRLLMRNAETGRGNGLEMAEAVGAKLIGMESFYGHIQYREAMTDGRFWPYPVMDSLCVSGLLVDRAGNRFCDESIGGVHAANCMARLDDPLGCHVIFDEAIWQGPGRDWLLPANPYLERAGGRLISENSLDQLAFRIGLDPKALARSVAAWNAAIDGQGAFEPDRSNAAYKAHPIRTSPFHAVPLCAGVTYTMGGILTDAAAQVLDAEERPIPGLLAAGACTGGLEGFSRDGYSGGLSKSATFGMIAGETAATLARAALREAV